MAKTCFVVGPIGSEDSETRKRSDTLLKYVIKKVLEDPPFQMVVDRADELHTSGLITQQIIERVVNADLVVADLAERNANVFYELSLRHAIQEPVVHLALSGQNVPFDIAQQRIIYYDTTNLAIAERAKEELRKQAEAAMNGTDAGDNPISSALVVLNLAQSKNTIDQSLARILTEVTDLREGMRLIQRTLAQSTTWATLGGETLKDRINTIITGRPIPTSSEEALLKKWFDLRAAIGQTLAEAPAPTCANCGEPITGPAGRRSADNAPIHWDGKCPPRPEPPAGTPST